MTRPHPLLARVVRITPDLSQHKPNERVLISELSYMLVLSDRSFIILTKQEWKNLRKRVDKNGNIPPDKSYVSLTKKEWADLKSRIDKDDGSIPSEKSYITA